MHMVVFWIIRVFVSRVLFVFFFCCTDAEKAARCSQEAPLLYGFAVHLRTGKQKGISLCLVTISLKEEVAGVWW